MNVLHQTSPDSNDDAEVVASDIAALVIADHKRFYDLLMHAPACIAVISGPDLIFEIANPAYCRLYDSKRNITGRPLLEVIPDMEPKLIKIIKRVATKSERFIAGELPIALDWNNDGKTYIKYFNVLYEPLLNKSKKPNGLICFASEITEQVQARQQAVESERQMRFMAESMPQMIFTVSCAGKVMYLNPQWEVYTGIALKRLLKNFAALQELIHPDDVRLAAKAWKLAFAQGTVLEHEYRLRRKDGQYRWHISRINPMKDSKGAVTLWVGSNTDIDDTKRAGNRRHELEIKTAALTEQRSQLLALNQAKDEFMSLASHQLRTPATGVKQYIGMLLQGYAGPVTNDQQMFLQTAYESNERQITIVNDLLQVARIDAGKVKLHKQPTDLVCLVKTVINEQASKFAERNQTVLFSSLAQQCIGRIDADRIRMVLDNIVDNASKYTEPDKTIRIKVRSNAKTASIIIKDQGIGLDIKSVDTIFQKFSRLNNPLSESVDGSGLGLYWAKKIVDLHQGSIIVTSAVGKGTTFTVTLPV